MILLCKSVLLIVVGVLNLHLDKKSHKVFSAHRILLDKGVLVRALNLHRDQKSLTRTGET